MAEARAFRFEQFQDYLTFERGLSDRTVSAYGRDLARWSAFLEGRGVVTPADAVARGANYLVIGRSITGAADPLAALERVHTELGQAL